MERKKLDTVPFMMFCKNPILWFACGFGSGLSPWAPGTAGSLVALLIYWWSWRELTVFGFVFVLLITFIMGLFLCRKAGQFFNVHDHKAIVWDEFVGMWVSLIPCIVWGLDSLFWLGISFVLFRFFDILKPWPISWVDKRFVGGLGIMFDDVIAGLFAALCVGALHYFM